MRRALRIASHDVLPVILGLRGYYPSGSTLQGAGSLAPLFKVTQELSIDWSWGQVGETLVSALLPCVRLLLTSGLSPVHDPRDPVGGGFSKSLPPEIQA